MRQFRRSLGLSWRVIAFAIGLWFGITAVTGDLISYHGTRAGDEARIAIGAKVFPWSRELRNRRVE